MHTELVELMAVLDEQTACYEALRQALIEEEGSFALCPTAAFDHIQSRKALLVQRLEQQERRRREMVDRLADRLDLEEPAVTVSLLAQRLDPPERDRLLSASRRLRSCLAAVRIQNRQNRQRIRHYLEIIDHGLKLLAGRSAVDPVYLKPGHGPGAGGYGRCAGAVFCGTA